MSAIPEKLPLRTLILVVACVALAVFYVAGATAHGSRMNTSKARGDQSGYLGDAKNVYFNWQGRQPPALIGERNRMPLYAGFLALVYDEAMSDDEFFEVAKRANIVLSLGLLTVLGVLFARHLPPLAAANLTLVVAFGYYVFKAGYAQSELLFYFLVFATFLGCWRLLRAGGPSNRTAGLSMLVVAALTGALAGLAHLTKAAVLPFVALFVAVHGTQSLATLIAPLDRAAGESSAHRAVRPLATVLVAAAFLAVLWPYLATSKRVFGHYFYNVNSTFYVWYEDWPAASVGTYSHGDGVGWPTLPASELPSAARYWREHTIGQIAARIGSGVENMAVVSYSAFGYLKYLVLYLGLLATIAATRPKALLAAVRAHQALAVFLAAYGLLYFLAIAFYFPTSGTGTGRFLIAHLTPLFFTLSMFFSSEWVAPLRWNAGRVTITPRHFSLLVSAVLAVDIAFLVWPRLMATYGGF
jgi:hypothetical protein